MKDNFTGQVLTLYITQSDETKTRTSVESVEVDNNGILKDKFYAKNLQRSILITSIDSYTLAELNSINIEQGSLGENILINVNPYSLLAGDKIKIGDVLLEITQNCTLCKGLSSVNSKLPKLLKNDRGIFAKVINQSGKIVVGDKVIIVNS